MFCTEFVGIFMASQLSRFGMLQWSSIVMKQKCTYFIRLADSLF